MRTYHQFVRISIRVEIIRVAVVKAYTRIRNGKVEMVRTHYRRY